MTDTRTTVRHARPNDAAGLGLYTKLGFVIEGTRRDALRVDGVFVDEYAMAMILA